MSELKVYHCNEWHNEYTEFYLKSEAYKVIAEKENKLQDVSELLKETREWLIEAQKLHKRCADNAIKMLRHSNYKRCMDNSFICFCLKRDADERSFQAYNKGLMDIMQKWNNKTIRYEKWQFKWFELAKKFKKAK